MGQTLVKTELPLELLKRNFTATLCKRIKELDFSGSLGDPIYHSEFLQIIRYFVKNNIGLINIETNGTGRPKKFWKELASMLRPDDCFYFSIDGLEDTNHIYRKGAKWDQIMEAVSIIKGHASLWWKFIVFKHNQHQIEEAKKRATELGFTNFQIVKSNLFGKLVLRDGESDPLMPDLKYVGERVKKSLQKQKIKGNKTIIKSITPSCKNGHRHFLSADGLYLPCCWLNVKRNDLHRLGLAIEDLNIYQNNLENILKNKNLHNIFKYMKRPDSLNDLCTHYCASIDETKENQVTFHSKTKYRLKD